MSFLGIEIQTRLISIEEAIIQRYLKPIVNRNNNEPKVPRRKYPRETKGELPYHPT